MANGSWLMADGYGQWLAGTVDNDHQPLTMTISH
jgi:hypothetical protein